MYITFQKNTKTKNEENFISLKHFLINYTLGNNEYIFQNSKFYLFVKSNYSKKHIARNLVDIEKLSIQNIQDFFKKDGFLVFINKTTSEIIVNRDLAGLCSGYYFLNNSIFSISTNVHDLANKQHVKTLNKEVVHQLLYFDFIWDGQTIYNSIFQFKQGAFFILNLDFTIVKNEFEQPNIFCSDNKMSEKENISSLRTEIVKAHEPYVNDKNIVFLSGGIDSVAMLIALTDLIDTSSIENHSFKVKGTTQDETVYAQSIANHLRTDLKIIERDFKDEINEKIFKEKIMKMNNPYSGMWIFGNQINNNENTTYFAGQDTRLHTPALNNLDKIAFSIFNFGEKGLKPLFYLFHIILSPIRFVFNFIVKRKSIKSKIFLGLRRALNLFNTKAYLNLVYFKLDKENLESFQLPLDYFETVKKNYNLDISKAKDKRSLYNVLVSKKWTEQYVNDIRYMVDMVDIQGGKLAMPFYDMDLAKFSATIPFNLANKTMKGKSQFDDSSNNIVNKYVLREALVDKIDKKTYLRSKAVSRTGHLIFTQGLDQILKEIITKDLAKENSFVKDYKLEPFLKRFLQKRNEWIMTDDKYLLKVYYTTCLIVYSNQLNRT